MPAVTGDGEVRLEPRVLRLWRIRFGSAVALVALVSFAGIAALGELVWAVVAAVSLTVALGALAWWWTAMVWRAWRFDVGDTALHLRHGVVVRHKSTIPFHRVQHIDTEAGPLERRLGLTTFVLRTASSSSDSTVPGIDATHAEALRERILALVGSGDAT